MEIVNSSKVLQAETRMLLDGKLLVQLFNFIHVLSPLSSLFASPVVLRPNRSGFRRLTFQFLQFCHVFVCLWIYLFTLAGGLLLYSWELFCAEEQTYRQQYLKCLSELISSDTKQREQNQFRNVLTNQEELVLSALIFKWWNCDKRVCTHYIYTGC